MEVDYDRFADSYWPHFSLELRKGIRWDGLRTEVARLAPRTDGLRPWTGPTPWTTLLP